MAEVQQNPEDSPPVDPAVLAASEATGHPLPSEYDSRGRTTVRTKHGHAVVPSDPELPVVTSDGVKMSKENAEKVVAEWPQYAFIDNEKED